MTTRPLRILAATTLIAGAGLLAACGSTSSNLSVDTTDIVYVKDDRTDLCFAFVGSGQALSPGTTGVAMSQVPCSDKVMALIE